MTDLDSFSSWLDLTRKVALKLQKSTEYESFWKRGARCDGRVFSETRQYTVQHGILPCAAGSALVKVKAASTSKKTTIVLTSVVLEVGQPSAAAPNQGDLVVQVTANGPLAGCADTATLQSFLQRLYEENIDLRQLMIEDGKSAFRLSLNVNLLEISGSIIDACVASISAALLDTKLPSETISREGIVHVEQSAEREKVLVMTIIPCSLTAAGTCFGIFGTSNNLHNWIVDPDDDEEQLQNSSITVVVNAASKDEILAIECSAREAVEPLAVARMTVMASGHAAMLSPILHAVSQRSM